MRWTVKTGLVIMCLAVLAAFGGATYQAIGTRVDEHRSPEPGVLVDIGGYRLKIFCVGAGSPTVVLESGLGDISVEWQPVQSVIAHFARICAYDRAGYGGSDAGPMPRTSATIAKELHTVLQRAGEKPPFVLVGHSFGGYNVRVFNGKYSNEVAGLVLVDSVQEDEYKLLPPAWKQFSADLLNHYERQARTAPLLINLGIARLMLQSRGDLHPNDYLILQAKYLRARASELKNIQTSAEQARAAGLIGDKPLIVLTAGRSLDSTPIPGLSPKDLMDSQRIWAEDLQPRLAHLSTRGKQVNVLDSGHDIPGERPDVVVEAVRGLCNAAAPHRETRYNR
jgi:pimeloyl-ACP methyl ester carboxylesterase